HRGRPVRLGRAAPGHGRHHLRPGPAVLLAGLLPAAGGDPARRRGPWPPAGGAGPRPPAAADPDGRARRVAQSGGRRGTAAVRDPAGRTGRPRRREPPAPAGDPPPGPERAARRHPARARRPSRLRSLIPRSLIPRSTGPTVDWSALSTMPCIDRCNRTAT